MQIILFWSLLTIPWIMDKELYFEQFWQPDERVTTWNLVPYLIQSNWSHWLFVDSCTLCPCPSQFSSSLFWKTWKTPKKKIKKCAPSITITQNEVVVSQLGKSGEERETVGWLRHHDISAHLYASADAGPSPPLDRGLCHGQLDGWTERNLTSHLVGKPGPACSFGVKVW